MGLHAYHPRGHVPQERATRLDPGVPVLSCDHQTDEKVPKETWGSDYLVVWAMASLTDGFREDRLSVASSESMGLQFIRRAVDASMKLHLYRYTHPEVYFRRQYPRLATIR